MKNIDQLLAFKLGAEQGNFSKAAEILGITAAAIGKQIKGLEDEFGIQLFYRTTRHVHLTQVGEAFYEQCEQILKELEKAKDLVTAYKGIVSGRLKIVSSIHFGERYIVPNLSEFLQTYPEVIIDFELADRIPDLEGEHIDLVFGLLSGLPPHYVQRRLKEDHYLFCASPSYIKKYGEPKKPRDLEKHFFITHSKRPDPTQLTFGNTKIIVKPHLWTNSTAAMFRCCLDGLGIVMLHSDIVVDAINNKKLVEVLKKYRRAEKTLYLYFKKMQYIQPNIRAFIDFILGKMK